MNICNLEKTIVIKIDETVTHYIYMCVMVFLRQQEKGFSGEVHKSSSVTKTIFRSHIYCITLNNITDRYSLFRINYKTLHFPTNGYHWLLQITNY